MTQFKLKSKEEFLQHLRNVRQRKEEWQKQAIAEYEEQLIGLI